jgi:CRP/FNR family transcriptional regulator, cyclic AMP receptor protein
MHMEVRPEDLRTIPLFREIGEKHLEALLKIFVREKVPAGQVLFRTGETDSRIRILIAGEVTLTEEGLATLVLKPLMLIGELGGLTGTPRNTTATASKATQFLAVEGKVLRAFFERHADTALVFYRTLLDVVSEKIRRDKERMDQMRGNIIRTQKSMKELRDLILSKPETVISKPVCEALEEHIARNRRAGYRVMPTEAFPSSVKLDDGSRLKVLEVSNGYLKLGAKSKQLTKDRSLWIGVLTLPTAEIAVSGSIEREDRDGVVVKLDTLVDEYKAALEDYVTRVQLLDFVV